MAAALRILNLSATYLRDYCGEGQLLQIRDKGQIKTGPINKHWDKMTGRLSNYTDNPQIPPVLEETLEQTEVNRYTLSSTCR